MKTVLLTGGAGFIASHTAVVLLDAGYEVVAVDNFANAVQDKSGMPVSLQRVQEITGKSLTFYKADLETRDSLKFVFEKHKIDCVIHFAALKAVGESITMPLVYYRNNLVSMIYLLETMLSFGVKNLVFSSSATVYGKAEHLPLTEASPVGQGITNPYGKSKFFIEEMLSDLSASDATWNIIILRYFNPVGAHPSGLIGEDPKGVPNNLMPYVAQVAVGKLPFVKVFGNDYDTVDGTGVRDYIHVVDLATGHLSALERIHRGACGLKVYNLGTGRGYSVLEMIAALEKASGKHIAYKMEGRRDGDLAAVYCDPTFAAQDLGWKAQFGLDDMSRDLWNWQQKNPNGFSA